MPADARDELIDALCEEGAYSAESAIYLADKYREQILHGAEVAEFRRFVLANADALRAGLDGLDLTDAEVEARLAAAHAQAEQRAAGKERP